ncbi:MAG TPA: type II toxin-antitoxin system RelE/ParE family toxin [Methyloceanibacter sp.]|nr:type II toxin-antitoxin system RelE/ParE family toxin [Methyloceanibacter sp.]
MAERRDPQGLGRRRTKSVQRLGDLSPLKSVGLHKLKGARKHQWAMTVNGPWRICFEFKKGDAYQVEIVDYHKG